MSGTASPTMSTSERIDTMLLSLRALINDIDDDGDRDGEVEQVLMDADLDGRRYILIRMPSINRKQSSLSPREIEIVRLVAGGHPNKVIAAVLEISTWTVCTHVRRVFAKLGVTSRAAMVARLSEFGGPIELAPASAGARRTAAEGADGRAPEGLADRPTSSFFQREPEPFPQSRQLIGARKKIAQTGG